MEECVEKHETLSLLAADYIMITGQDAFEQGDLGASTQPTKEDCQAVCDNHPSCNAFAFSVSESSLNCYIKQLAQGFGSNSDLFCYIKM